MKIQRATFLGIRGVPDGSYELCEAKTGAPASVVVVTGPEASGKTRFLEAIFAAKEAIGPYGPMSPGAAWLLPGAPIAKIVLSLWLDAEERQYVGTHDSVVQAEAIFLPQRTQREADEGTIALLQRYTHDNTAGKFEYFPASRRLLPQGPFLGTSVLEQRMQRASKDPRKYGFVLRFLRDLSDDPAREQAFARVLERLSSSCRYERNQEASGMPRCLVTRVGRGQSIAEIADSEADCVLLAATAVTIGLSRSVVLIDRPCLFMGAGRAKAFLEALRALGQDNQVLCASNTPEFVAAAAGDTVISLGSA